MFFRENSAAPDIDPAATLAELKTDSAYNSSVVLFAAALLKNEKRYKEALTAIQEQLKEDTSFKAWMLGRIVLAATHMDDKETIAKITPVLKNLLKNVEKDECHAWALGYLAAINPAEFKENCDVMLQAANALTKKPGDTLWAHVMNLQAAARAHDETIFNKILSEIKSFTQKETIAEALAVIPADDWRAWALGITAESATTMRNKDLYQELSSPLLEAIKEAVNLKSMANAMLAKISATAADCLPKQSNVKKQ